jgi:hypothetical protein
MKPSAGVIFVFKQWGSFIRSTIVLPRSLRCTAWARKPLRVEVGARLVIPGFGPVIRADLAVIARPVVHHKAINIKAETEDCRDPKRLRASPTRPSRS